jgi:hypothetical protein
VGSGGDAAWYLGGPRVDALGGELADEPLACAVKPDADDRAGRPEHDTDLVSVQPLDVDEQQELLVVPGKPCQGSAHGLAVRAGGLRLRQDQ